MLLNALRIAAAILVALFLFVLVLGCAFSGGMRVAIPTAVAATLATLVAAWVAWRTRGPSGPFSWASLAEPGGVGQKPPSSSAEPWP